MPAPPIVMQTTYAELLERCAAVALTDSVRGVKGNFVVKTVRNRRYWYFQSSSPEGRTQRYVGPETPELSARIAAHKDARDDERERRALVSTLVRSFGMPRPEPELGDVVAALAKAGVFRLGAVLVGTVAYQTYSPMLGTKLPARVMRTGDVDIARFRKVSVAADDSTTPMLDVLKEVEPDFEPVPSLHAGTAVSYQAKGGLRVDFLTPNEGPETDEPEPLPGFHTDAQPLRFLGFLIRDPEPAVVLHEAGVYVQVPSPARFAIHKLIVSQRRHEGTGKRDKDIEQAQSLVDLLVDKRPRVLAEAWSEAVGQGKRWRALALGGLTRLDPGVLDRLLRLISEVRGSLPGIDLSFASSAPRYDFDRDAVSFAGEATPSEAEVAFHISGEALDDHFDGRGRDNKNARTGSFLANRSEIERLARIKYLQWPVERPNEVHLSSLDIPDLRKAASKPPAARKRRTPT